MVTPFWSDNDIILINFNVTQKFYKSENPKLHRNNINYLFIIL